VKEGEGRKVKEGKRNLLRRNGHNVDKLGGIFSADAGEGNGRVLARAHHRDASKVGGFLLRFQSEIASTGRAIFHVRNVSTARSDFTSEISAQ
jgi:hypothetical protein